jgi:hypothetical protein
MTVAKTLKDQTEKTVRSFVNGLNQEEKLQLLTWSEKALTIRNDNSLEKIEKIKALSKIENAEAAKIVLGKLFIILKDKIWTNQSWARRLGFAGLATGLTFGGTAVGIATMGAGMGVPLMVMTAAGGVILGSAIDEIKKELK